MLEARALSDMGRHELALEVIANIEGREGTRLRADIYWAARRWREGAEQIELLYGDRWRDFEPFSDTERSDLLRAAMGYALGEDMIGLDRFREKYAAKMAEGPDGRAFDIASSPLIATSAEFRDVAKMIASVDTLEGFLRDMRARYPESGAISAGTAASSAPAAPAQAVHSPPAVPSAAPKAKPNEPTGSLSRPAVAGRLPTPARPIPPRTAPARSASRQ